MKYRRQVWVPSAPSCKRMLAFGCFVLSVCWCFFSASAVAQDAAAQDPVDGAKPSPEAIQFFETKIRPVLVDQCYSCHSNDGQAVRGGLMVDSREALRIGGESGPAIVPGNLEESWLWNAINHVDFQMPPRQKLPAAVLKDFETWIMLGAPDPRTGDVEVVQTRVTPEAIEEGRQHWAYQPPESPLLAEVSDSAWPQTDIDRLIVSGQRQAGLEPVADADAHTVLRRLHFDLVGLPPKPAVVSAFVKAWEVDPTRAVAAEVDRLLALPQFGERWGRHWLDVARYAESTGKEIDRTYPHAWRYRDFVIDSFNQDKPYDHFVRQQIAGDLLPVDSDQQWSENLIATAFLAIGPKTIIERNPRQFQADLIDEQIDVTTRVVLGMSVACARCHDHKFDPIPQSDYYALAGIFQSTETFFGGARSQRNNQGSNLLILPVEDQGLPINSIDSTEYAELKKELEDKQQELVQTEREQRELLRSGPGNASQQEIQRIRARALLLERQVSGLREQLNQFDQDGRALSLAMGVQDAEQLVNARLLVRGEINQPAQEVTRGFVQVICEDSVAIPKNASGRLQLANWMTSRENPLTARVMVNRIWHHMLGKPLVAETDNFGRSGEQPQQLQLLDYLAVRFMDSGWSVKTIVKEIANSRVYRLSTSQDRQLQVLDPENVWLARANPKRLEAEAIRDAMLMASGQLDLDRPRGSKVAELGLTVIGPDGLPLAQQFNFRDRPTPLTEIGGTYRSVYLPITRSAVPRSLEVFDFAEPTMVVGVREESNTATQSLYLLNNPFVIEQSEKFAQRVQQESDSLPQAVRKAFAIAYGRAPSNEEFKAGIEFLKDANIEFGGSKPNPVFTGNLSGRPNRPMLRNMADRLRQAREANTLNSTSQSLSPMAQFCQALFASAEFRYLN